MNKQLWVIFLCVLGTISFAQTNLAPDITAWQAVPGLQHIESGAGIDGEPALVYERSDGKEYKFTRVKLDGLVVGTRYLVGVYVKTVGMKKGTGGGATVAIEYDNSVKTCAGGVWPKGVVMAKDWTKVEGFVTIKEGARNATMLLYMRKGATGTAYFSRPYIYETKKAFFSDIISPMCKYSMTPGKTDLEFGTFADGIKIDGMKVTLDISRDGKPFSNASAQIIDGRLRYSGLDLAPGEYAYRLTCENADYEIETGNFRVLQPGAKPEKGTHVTIDEAGRIIVDGKPFMPVGMYSNLTDASTDFKIWHDAGFNCMMPYDAMYWKRCEKAPNDPAERAREVRKALDELDALGIKLLFSLKDIHPAGRETYGRLNGHKEVVELLVSSLKDHPAILGWYLNDEVEDNLFYRDFRYRVSKLDPFHPTFQVQCRLTTMASTIGYSDVFMVDPYPFNKAEDGSKLCRDFMKVATDIFGKAVVSVPQTFEWYFYRKDAKDTFFPTMEQMRGHILLEAAMGSKGFILYTYRSCKRHKEKTGIDRWPDILDLTKMLHSLEPFIMSLDKAPTATVTTKEGEVIATAFSANGNVTAIISSIQGKTTAEVLIPGQPNLKSRYGLTRNLGDGRYLYEAAGCDGDILE